MNILFLGDSITDWGRSRPDGKYLGEGYVKLVADTLRKNHPDIEFDFTNTGISGDRTGDVIARLDVDAIDRKPDLVVLMIGINDVWRRYDRDQRTSALQFERNYGTILDALINRAKAKLVLMEPFLLDVPDKPFRPDLDPKLVLIRRIAKKRRLPLIRLDELFSEASVGKPSLHYAGDGIHPSPEGAAFIAERVVAEIEKLL
ncbi:MAG TPA: GDSL family lipase [Acholeplasmatales bacterium]|nr:MAG: hypothetical protein A2Y16_05620 [Tenericutes bacterium GWF2_57_13]HAQ56020.1 GDSL family lipase [Acholeplasmatales bacterium]